MAALAHEVAVLGNEGLIHREEFLAAMLPKTKYLDVRATCARPVTLLHHVGAGVCVLGEGCV
jgi:hypothetical protein